MHKTESHIAPLFSHGSVFCSATCIASHRIALYHWLNGITSNLNECLNSAFKKLLLFGQLQSWLYEIWWLTFGRDKNKADWNAMLNSSSISDFGLNLFCGNRIVADVKIGCRFVENLFWFIKRFVLVPESSAALLHGTIQQIYGVSYTHIVDTNIFGSSSSFNTCPVWIIDYFVVQWHMPQFLWA